MSSGGEKKVGSKPEGNVTKSKGWRSRRYKKSISQKGANKYRSSDFAGKTKELEGFYFDAMASNQADGFNRTKKAILNFIARSSKTGPFIEESLRQNQLCCGALPVKPEDNADDIEKAIHVEEVKIFAKQRQDVKNGLMCAYHTIIGQCTPIMLQRLEQYESYAEIKKRSDAIELLKLIRNVNFKFQDHTYVYKNIFSALQRLISYRKGANDDLVKHRENIKIA